MNKMGLNARENVVTTTSPEARTPVMILVEANWEDQSGTVQKCSARMENRSTSGACIRLRRPVHVGAKLHLRWRWEKFVGSARYCRSDGRDYLVGLHRIVEQELETKKTADTEPLIKAREIENGPDAMLIPMAKVAVHNDELGEDKNVEPAIARSLGKGSANEQAAIGSIELTLPRPQAAKPPCVYSVSEPIRKLQENLILRGTDPPKEAKQQRDEPHRERKHMRRKWFDLTHWSASRRITRNGCGATWKAWLARGYFWKLADHQATGGAEHYGSVGAIYKSAGGRGDGE